MNSPSDKSPKLSTYRDMHLLNEVTRTPDATQRELSRRIGVALGLTNLLLRRLVNKGYIKISGTKRSRLRYLITPQGLLEKTRLTYEFIEYSLQLYSRVRHFLREQLAILVQTGNRRVLLYGTGELAEIAFLIIREMGIELVGIIGESWDPASFVGYPVQRPGDLPLDRYDRLIVALPAGRAGEIQHLIASGIPGERMIILPLLGTESVRLHAAAGMAGPSAPPGLVEAAAEGQPTAEV